MQALEGVLAQLSLFEHLRPDEIARIAARFRLETIPAGGAVRFEATPDGARLLVAVRGSIVLEVESPAGPLRSELEPGDRHGDIALLAGIPRPVKVTTEDEEAVIGTVDRAGLDAILHDFPAAALPLAVELASELRSRQDVARQLLELHAE